MQDNNIYSFLGRDLYKLNSSPTEVSSVVNPSNIDSGTQTGFTELGYGGIKQGKTKFDNTETGFILGIDDGLAKFYIGNTTNYLNWTGTALVISGTLTIGAGSSGIANLSDAGALATLSVIGNAYITDLSVDKLTAGTISSKSIVLAVAAGTGDVEIRSGIASGDFANTGAASGFIIGLDDSDSDKAKFYFGDATNYVKFDNTTLTASGAIVAGAGSSLPTTYLSGLVGLANTNVAAQGWTQTCAFSVTDLDTVAWGAGTLTTAGGTAYSIGAGNTGNMAARTYIYLDIAVSTTAYQVTTTAGTAVGAGKVLVATAINGAVEPTFEVFGGVGGLNINGSSIVAASITGSEIAANTITAGLISVSQLSAITADVGTLTAGTITGLTIRTAASGQRVLMDSTGVNLFNSAGTQVGWFNASATESTNGLALKDGTDQTLLYIENSLTTALTKETAIIVNRGTGKPAAFFKNYNIASATNTVGIEQAGTGSGLYVNVTLATNADYAGDFRNAGTSGGALYAFTGSNSTSTVAKFEQTATVSTNFKRILNLDGMIIYKSNGTTPNGNLSGAAGDLCVNGLGGATFYCTGTTNWTAM